MLSFWFAITKADADLLPHVTERAGAAAEGQLAVRKPTALEAAIAMQKQNIIQQLNDGIAQIAAASANAHRDTEKRLAEKNEDYDKLKVEIEQSRGENAKVVDKLRADYDQVKGEKEMLEVKYAKLEKKHEKETKTKDRFKAKCERIEAERNELKEKYQDMDVQVGVLESTKAALEKELETQIKLVNSLHRRLVREDEAVHRRRHVVEENRSVYPDGRSTNFANGDGGDEMHAALKGLDKELVDKINHEIVDSGEKVTLNDIAGLDEVKKNLDLMLILPMKRPQLFTGLLDQDVNGLLLHGPPGTGKL